VKTREEIEALRASMLLKLCQIESGEGDAPLLYGGILCVLDFVLEKFPQVAHNTQMFENAVLVGEGLLSDRKADVAKLEAFWQKRCFDCE